MSARELRGELASLVRTVRLQLERERFGGHAELLAQSARKAAGKSARKAQGAAGPATRTRGATLPAGGVARDATNAVAGHATPPVNAAAAVRPRAVTREAGRAWHPAGVEARQAIARHAAPLLEAIAHEVERCRSCALWETRTKAVPGVGSALSGIVFVGEAPGADEDRRGEPFVGRAGQLLDKIIKAMDDAKLIPGVPLSRETVFIGNVIHCRPPDNRVPLPFEVQQSSPFLERQLAALQPRIICCLGKTAAEHLLGRKSSLAGMRGQTYRHGEAKLIVTYHPAAVLRNPDLKRPVWDDMQRLAREYQQD